MTIERPQVGWGFWLQWVLVTSVGWVLGLPLGLLGGSVAAFVAALLKGEALAPEQAALVIGVPFTAALLSVIGATVGTMQWLILRRKLDGVASWILASSVGGALGGAVGLGAFSPGASSMSASAGDAVQAAELFALIGAIIGVAQWLVLRGKVRTAPAWVLASGLGWSLPAGLGTLVATSLGDQVHWAVLLILVGTVTGPLVGAITGIAIVWLLRIGILTPRTTLPQNQVPEDEKTVDEAQHGGNPD